MSGLAFQASRAPCAACLGIEGCVYGKIGWEGAEELRARAVREGWLSGA